MKEVECRVFQHVHRMVTHTIKVKVPRDYDVESDDDSLVFEQLVAEMEASDDTGDVVSNYDDDLLIDSWEVVDGN